MQLPGRLKATTLGDVLGALHRGGASGILELVESNGRVHRVHLANGLVTAVEVDRASASLGEILQDEHALDDDTLRRSLLRAIASRRLHGDVLVRDFRLSPSVVDRALRRQMLLRLQMLEELADAQLLYRAAVKPPRGALTDQPLGASEFLVGRRRARDRAAESSGTFRTSRASSGFPGSMDTARIGAYRSLGLANGASSDEVKRAYRRLVREYHPDLHPDASTEERRALASRFHEVTAAYKSLVA
jgi:DnaJ-domain-containing protein 1